MNLTNGHAEIDYQTCGNELKIQGNALYKAGRYVQALRTYDMAIGVMSDGVCLGISNLIKELAVLWNNRANALFKLEKWEESLFSAQQSLQLDPSFVKAYYRAGYSLVKLYDIHSALNVFVMGLMQVTYTADGSVVVDFLHGIFMAYEASGVNDVFIELYNRILRQSYNTQIWKLLIVKLVKEQMYKSCLFLMSSRDRLTKDVKDLKAPLGGIFEKYVSSTSCEKLNPISQLVTWLIEMGADVDTIGEHSLHAVIKLCMKSVDSRLFHLVLRTKPAMKKLINEKDSDGNTVLHLVASFSSNDYSPKRQAQDVKMLLNYGGDPCIANKQGKDVASILKRNKNFKAEDIIKKHLASQIPAEVKSTSSSEVCSVVEIKTDSLEYALEQFTAFCKQTDQDNTFFEHESVKNFLRVLSSVKEIPPDMICDIPDSMIESLITKLIQEQKWKEVLLLLTRDTSGESTQRGLMKRCPLPNINICHVLSHLNPTTKYRLSLIKLLLEQGVSPNGIGDIAEHPISTCLNKSDFAVACLILRSGGDPERISITQGDTPLHAVVSIALNNQGDNGVLMTKHLLDLYSKEPLKYPYLDPNTQDYNGDTVMHMVFQSNNPKQYRRIMDLLAKFDIKLTINNSLGRDVKYKIKNTDPHFIAWNDARKKCKHNQPPPLAKSSKTLTSKNTTQLKAQSKPLSSASLPDSGCNQSVDTDPLLPPEKFVEHIKKAMTPRDSLEQTIRDLINSMEPSKCPSVFVSVRPSLTGQHREENTTEIPVVHTDSVPDFDKALNDNSSVVSNINECGENGSLVHDDNEEDFELVEENIDLSNLDFNNMTWEIECSPEALKKLGSKAVPQYMKNKIIISIQKLANGEWTRSLHKHLKLKSNIKLYEVKLDKGARLLWELAIDFSPRCSEDPEKILATQLASEKTGRIYTEIIRIWDIVLDHCKLNHAIESICSAYNRGLTCILRKKLKGITKVRIFSNAQKRIPRYFLEDTELERDMEPSIPDYFPPASAAETEYNILKFHSFSTDMALNILSNMNYRVEYPFRVGELEYAVIDLNPKPMETIILIGRSGTGKTTCCLYRLWKKFHSYWEKAESVGPWLVKQTWQRRKFSENVEGNDDTDNEENSETESSDCAYEEEAPEPENIDADDNMPEHGEETTVKLEHYHPVFITKNHVLCQEVQRNFLELSKSTKSTSHFMPLEPNVYRFQDIKDENFPLFITSQQLLMLLDASMPDPFFPRNDDGSLKRNIVGWSTLDNIDIIDLLREDEEIEPDPENEEEENNCDLKETDPRIFVTFELFAYELWPKIKGKSPYNAALVWKEIKSFLKGSFEALSCHQGRLTEQEYMKLGRKRAPNFEGDRKEIYSLFCTYEQMKCQLGYFDEEDVLYNLSCRLSKLEELPWSIHELYGDEIQDFTQAELFLLMRCINDPNSMFLTGDTAQSIMKGVAFRFSDLRSLFYFANKNGSDGKKNCIVRKPKQLYHLYQNYRSHSGILHLASGVVDLLQYFFPESFDRLPRDCGLFDGPKPTVLESCCVSDLAILLRGNKRKTQPIEFGAHQVILVKNEIAKENIPEELSLALVLTIYEAKGLEFDDVLLYNFFTDSEASKEWKIISSFNPVVITNEERQPLIEVPLESSSNRTNRQLLVDPEMHKIVNGEMKQLYTAITRARVNLWIFDENQEKRAPAFTYFMKGNFVKVVRTDVNKDIDDNMFVKTSTKKEWISQGDYYANHHCWKVAAKCYQKGEALEKEKLAFAHDEVLQLQSRKASPREKQMGYMMLAKTYLECKEAKLALKCLMKANKFKLCGELCKKLEKTKDAAYFYKKAQENKVAAQLYEQSGEFEAALNLYYHGKMYEEAADVIERHHRKHPDAPLQFNEKQFYLEASAEYFRNNKLKKMSEMLSKLDVEDQLVFLKNRRCWSEAADLLKSKNRCEEAACFMRENGRLLEAADLTRRRAFRASCLLAAARHSIANGKNPGTILSEALQLFTDTNNQVEASETILLQGILESDFEKIRKSFFYFKKSSHHAGVVEALLEASICDESNPKLLTLASYGLESLVTLLKALKDTKSNAEREMVKYCLEFYGLVQVDEHQCSILQHEGARFLQIKVEEDKEPVELKDVKLWLQNHFLKKLFEISKMVLGNPYPDVCDKYIIGLECTDENCQSLQMKNVHEPLQHFQLRKILQSKVNLITICGLLVEAQNISKDFSDDLEEIVKAHGYNYCNSFLRLVFSKHFHLRVLSENSKMCRDVLLKFPVPGITMLNKFLGSLFTEDKRSRRESTDFWLKVMQICSLQSRYPHSLQRFLEMEERAYSEEYNKQNRKVHYSQGIGNRIKYPEGRHGMLKPEKSSISSKVTHIHFFRLLQTSLQELYVTRDPDSCKRHFYRFMNLLVRKCVEPLIPNIGNTVMLLEFQFILCSATLMRFCKEATVVLPKSYISILHYWEFMFGKKGSLKDTYAILWEYKPKDLRQLTWEFRHHLFYLAAVLVGEENTEFNVLLDAFSCVDCVTSGEAERTLVLWLVMMVNLTGVVNEKARPILTNYIPMIQNKLISLINEFPSRVPSRLISAVDKVASTENTEDLISVLQELLGQRDDERLVECSWRWDIMYSKGQVRGIYFDDKFKFRKFSYVQYNIQNVKPFSMDNEQEEFEEEKVDLLAAMAADVEKQIASRKMHTVFLVAYICIKWKKATNHMSKTHMEEVIPDNFKRAYVDRTQCDLCGVKFSKVMTFSDPLEIEEDPEEVATPTMKNIEEIQLQDVRENYENHTAHEKHREQNKAYRKYLQFFQLTVDTVINEGKSLIETMEHTSANRLTSREELRLEQTKIENKIKIITELMEDIYERKNWALAEELMINPVNDLASSISKGAKLLKKTEYQMPKTGDITVLAPVWNSTSWSFAGGKWRT
ncbi:TPR and ankyrin repeat-containing protein 1 isoform X2 [Pseudophryne corroboree]|uniref:TPR and ankyrin repeat-containing protein 1 isoform X2 n=1 Tax=Pseudophryne corroboree TaxID=495146 RepID=UPI00308199DD